jgi:hypothetical protein
MVRSESERKSCATSRLPYTHEAISDQIRTEVLHRIEGDDKWIIITQNARKVERK